MEYTLLQLDRDLDAELIGQTPTPYIRVRVGRILMAISTDYYARDLLLTMANDHGLDLCIQFAENILTPEGITSLSSMDDEYKVRLAHLAVVLGCWLSERGNDGDADRAISLAKVALKTLPNNDLAKKIKLGFFDSEFGRIVLTNARVNSAQTVIKHMSACKDNIGTHPHAD